MEVDNNKTYRYRLSYYFNVYQNMNYVRFIEFLKKSVDEDLDSTILLTIQLRDCRGGKGQRQLFRWALQWLFLNYPEKIERILRLIPDFGRWDDLYVLFPNSTVIERSDNYLSDVNDHKRLNKLQQKVVNIITSQLKKDYDNLQNGKNISKCGKWAVSENSSLDRKYNIVDSTCRIWGISKKRYRQTLSSLRKKLHIPERYLCQGDGMLKYDEIPSGAIQKYYKTFLKRDSKRFRKHIQNYQKNKIYNIENILPYKIIEKYNVPGNNEIGNKEDGDVEEKWSEYFVTFPYRNEWDDVFFVMDVSGSMYTTGSNKNIDKIPINVGLSLGLLTQDKIFNLSEHPEKVELKKETLLKYIQKVVHMNYSNDVDLDKMIANLKIKKNQKLFIVTDQNLIVNTYPFNITIWNVSDPFIKVKKIKDVLYLNGFSKCVYNHVLQNPFFDPSEIVDNIVNDVKYKKILEKIKTVNK